ncbi:MAG: hypothetical protein AABX86_00155 [Nanoarchaeota archaeon]
MDLLIAVVIYSALLAFTIKIADLLDEHGLFLFRGAAVLFGILWGTAFVFLMWLHPLLASFWLALLLHWIIFMKFDFFNHALALAIILLAILWKPPFVDWNVLFSALVVYTGIALLHRYHMLKKNLFWNLNGHVFLLLLLFLFLDQQYSLLLLSYGVESAVYHTTKYVAALQGYA